MPLEPPRVSGSDACRLCATDMVPGTGGGTGKVKGTFTWAEEDPDPDPDPDLDLLDPADRGRGGACAPDLLDPADRGRGGACAPALTSAPLACKVI